MGEMKHGVRSYNRGCRCDVCRESKAEARRQGHPPMSKVKLPVEPFLEVLKRNDQSHLLEPHRLYQWRKAGGINVYWADVWAMRFGFHPVEIWGMDFYEGCLDADSSDA